MNSTVKILDVKESILENNDLQANNFRNDLKKKGTLLINIMSSPGSGKTSTLFALIPYLKMKYTLGVIEADIDSDVDAKKIAETGINALQVHTGGMCHLDASMTQQSLEGLQKPCDMVFLENIGNLVCPAEYDTGAYLNIAILSIPEGDDKPAKYPLMFSKVNAVVFNKIDTLSYFDFDLDKCKKTIESLNPHCDFFTISAKNGNGVKELADWIDHQFQEYR